MRESTIARLASDLTEIIAQKTSLIEYAKSIGRTFNYYHIVRNNMASELKNGKITQEQYNLLMGLFNEYQEMRDNLKGKDTKPVDGTFVPPVTKTVTAPKETKPVIEQKLPFVEEIEVEDDDYESRVKTSTERDSKNRISGYKFLVLIKNKPALQGMFTRDEMNMVYRLYSNYGSSITQREVSRFFPEYSLEDFKRILRAFNITKASAPFAPHVIEECSKTELSEMQLREKENDFLRSLEAEKVRNNEKLLKKYAAENLELKEKLRDGSHLLESFDLGEIPDFCKADTDSEKDLIIWLSDMHIGAAVAETSIYVNQYDEKEVERRMDLIVERMCLEFANLYTSSDGFDNIVVCNIGDSLDGYNAQTTRGGHALPQNMDNKQQLNVYVRVMTKFFAKLLVNVPCNRLSYFCVGESNHDGDFGYAANVALSAILDTKGVNTTVFDKFIGEFKMKDTTYILCHGKDNKDMFKNLPLTLDVKTENFINEYLDNRGISGNVVFVKGDLHQSATTYGRRFAYKSVSSIFGSSEWIHKNFGNTKAACDYTIGNAAGSLLDGRIVLQ